MRFPNQCDAAQGSASQLVLTDVMWRVLQRVNAEVNRSIWPEDDEAHYGRAEYWTIPSDGYGDCDDYALTKRRDLIAAGFSPRALRIAIAISPRFGRHAVLIAVTDRGDLVLDNLTDQIADRRQVPYRWIEQQDGTNPREWISLGGPMRETPHSAVGSVK